MLTAEELQRVRAARLYEPPTYFRTLIKEEIFAPTPVRPDAALEVDVGCGDGNLRCSLLNFGNCGSWVGHCLGLEFQRALRGGFGSRLGQRAVDPLGHGNRDLVGDGRHRRARFRAGRGLHLSRNPDDLASAALGIDLVDPGLDGSCLLYTSPSPRARTRYRMPSSA